MGVGTGRMTDDNIRAVANYLQGLHIAGKETG
jgi:hypothetical protein